MIHYRVAGRAGGAVLRGAVLHAALRLAHPRGPARHRPRLRSPHPLLSGEYFNNYYLLINLFIHNTYYCIIAFPEIPHHPWVLVLRRRHPACHHWLLHPGLAGAGLGVGAGQGELWLVDTAHAELWLVQVDVEDTHVDIMATIPKCWMAWIVSGIWPTIFLIGDITKLFIMEYSPVLPLLLCPGLIVQSCCTGTGTHHEESLPQVRQLYIHVIIVSCWIMSVYCVVQWCHLMSYLLQVKYTKHTEQAETKEERKQRKYRYLYQVNPRDIVTICHNMSQHCHAGPHVSRWCDIPGQQAHSGTHIYRHELYLQYLSTIFNLSTISNIQSTYNLWYIDTQNLERIYNLMQGKYIQHLDTESAAFRWPPLPQLGK